MSDDLKPCPFCGSVPHLSGDAVYCTGCSAEALTVEWNTRAPVRVKLPTRYNDNAGRAITADKHGRWFLADDVLAALKAQGVEVE